MDITKLRGVMVVKKYMNKSVIMKFTVGIQKKLMLLLVKQFCIVFSSIDAGIFNHPNN